MKNPAAAAVNTVEKVLNQKIKAKKRELLHWQAQREAAERAEVDCFREISEMELAIAVFRRAFGLESEPPAATELDLLRLRTQTIVHSCVEIMRANGGRARVTDITKRLVAAGKLKDYRKGYATVAKTLDRDERFRRIGRGEFELTESRQASLLD